ncbi:MAG: glycosyltransferase family 9 protein [Bryobacteraceae bacterium]|nr:glycosyltransferase family 9 protein [Bryobacteraceae bacterium]
MEFLCRDVEAEVWAPSPVLPLIRFIERKASIASTGLDLLGLPEREAPPRLLSRLGKFDEIVSWYGANREEFRRCVEELRLPFRFLPALPPPEGREHAADFFLRQVGGAPPAIPRVPCERRDDEFVVIHPFSGSARKNWPLDKFRVVAEGLPDVRWCAGPEEVLPEATRFDDLYELARWLARARLFIGNDSGIAHLAAAVGTPVIALFGPTDPAVWAPRGSHVRILPRMENVTPSQVLQLV